MKRNLGDRESKAMGARMIKRDLGEGVNDVNDFVDNVDSSAI